MVSIPVGRRIPVGVFGAVLLVLSAFLILSQKAHAETAPDPTPVHTEFDDAGIEVTRQVTKVVGAAEQPARAGDVLQFHVAVKNVSGRNFSGDERLTFNADLSEMADDAVIVGARAGTSRSSSYCGPTGWGTSGTSCSTVAIDAEQNVSKSINLNNGATYYFNYRVQVDNEFAGDLLLNSKYCIDGLATACDSFSEIEIEPTYGDIEVERSWTKVSGDSSGPVRAGDVLQFHVKVTNTGQGDWTAPSGWAVDKRLTLSSDVLGLTDDAVLTGVRQGTNGSNSYCGPTGWGNYSTLCAPVSVDEEGSFSHEFALKAGASHYFNIRVKISDRYEGDQVLENTVCVEGHARGDVGLIRKCADDKATMTASEPDLDLDLEWSKRPVADRDARPGDRIDFKATVTNPGEGDWDVASDWAHGSPARFEMDLADVLDDGEWISGKTGTTSIEPVDGKLKWEGNLRSGARRAFEFTVRVKNTPEIDDEALADRLMLAEACASGEYRHVDGEMITVSSCGDAQIPISEFWTMNTSVVGEDGVQLPNRGTVSPGETLTYIVSAVAEGGWPLDDAQIVTSLEGALQLGELASEIRFDVPGITSVPLALDGETVTTPRFTLPADITATITFQVRIPSDLHSGTLTTEATGDATVSGIGQHEPGVCGSERKPCTTEHRVVQRAPSVTKTAEVNGEPAEGARIEYGDEIAYHVEVTNPGPGVWTADNPLSIVDDMRDVLDNAKIAGEQGAEVTVTRSWSEESETILLEDAYLRWSGAVPAGGSVAFSVNVKVFETWPQGANRRVLNSVCTGAEGAERYCDEVGLTLPAMQQAEPEAPTYGPLECGSTTWIHLPVTPGVTYTFEGEPTPGGTTVVTATAKPGYTLEIPKGWQRASDGRTATLTIHYPSCDAESRLIADLWVDASPGSCSADPSLDLIETEGVTYTVEGDLRAGSTVTVTAEADEGYSLRHSRWQRWEISPDRTSATYIITFPEFDCDGDIPSGWTGIRPDMPRWGGHSCHFGGEEPWFEMPETEGLTYEIIDGEVARGSGLTIQVTSNDGEPLGWQWNWTYSKDRLTATYKVYFPELGDCTPGDGGGGDDDSSGGPGDGEGGNSGGDNENDNGNSGGDEEDQDEVKLVPPIPVPGGLDEQCVDGEPVITDVYVHAIEGVRYEITGSREPGGRLIVTAYTEDGYLFTNIGEWAAGVWDVAEDRKSAVRIYDFPEAEEICEPREPGEPADPEEPVEPGEPENPDDSEGSTDPEEPGEPEEPGDSQGPTEPSEPDVPGDPLDPVDPDEPNEPGEPAEPVNPGEPNEPVEPEQPGSSEDTEDSHEPAEPEETGDSEVAEEPGDPADPESGTEPEISEREPEGDHPSREQRSESHPLAFTGANLGTALGGVAAALALLGGGLWLLRIGKRRL